jgi:hypothetical protein
MVHAIGEAQQAGQVRAGDPEELPVAAWALVHGLSALLIDGQLRRQVRTKRDAEVLAGRVSHLLQTGLARD